ncbi:MAG: 3-deoxy-manno-octulosonate cytidylyltransferase [Planctomycetota bacterium]
MVSRREPPPDPRARPSALAVVPARLGSTRLPRKMLLRDTGRYLFEHTVRNAERCALLERVVLATDSAEIMRAAQEVGVTAIATSPDHPSGTDRVAEAHRSLLAAGEGPWDVVVNVQGDEPELPPADLELLIGAFAEAAVEIATLSAPIATREEALDPGIVKVVTDARGEALYFSRSPIPSLDHPSRPMAPGAPGLAGLRRHLGVYAFRPTALAFFCALPRGGLEATESLEQLRWLEAGRRMRVLPASRLTLGIDTAEHYAAFRAAVRAREAPASAPALPSPPRPSRVDPPSR